MDAETTNPFNDYVNRFHDIAASGDLAKLQVIVKGTLDINAVNEKGWTALMYAARNGQSQAAKMLIDHGCDVSTMNGSGQTALDIANFWNHSDTVKLLSNSETTSDQSRGMPNQGMVHYFCGDVLDRCAHLRKDAQQLEEEMKLPTSYFVLFTDLNAYVTQVPDHTASKSQNSYQLLRVRYTDISSYLQTKPLVIFLGKEKHTKPNAPKSAIFAVDSGGLTEEQVKVIEPHAHLMTSFFTAMQLDAAGAAILSQARPVLAWHERYSFCPTCGSKTIAEEGGYKRTCEKEDCKSRKGIHNTSYPRVDPTVIMAVESPDGTSLLLGRGARHPRKMWSCLAGFMEPGESMEDACRREVEEESGVKVGRVHYHSCQSWPHPTSLMIGCIGYATSEHIQVDPEELEAARWFPRQEVVQMLTSQHPEGLYIPPPQAIAHHLVKAWVNMTSNL